LNEIPEKRPLLPRLRGVFILVLDIARFGALIALPGALSAVPERGAQVVFPLLSVLLAYADFHARPHKRFYLAYAPLYIALKALSAFAGFLYIAFVFVTLPPPPLLHISYYTQAASQNKIYFWFILCAVDIITLILRAPALRKRTDRGAD
jgi:hypothetical protein